MKRSPIGFLIGMTMISGHVYPQSETPRHEESPVKFDITFNDPERAYELFYPSLSDHFRAAGTDWARHLDIEHPVTIEILVNFDDIPTACGGSMHSVLHSKEGDIETYEQSVAAELRTGIDPNGSHPDMSVTLGIRNLLDGTWWFDPDPYARLETIPEGKLDAYSTILHEFGHALVYNGWREHNHGALPGDYQSVFDSKVIELGGTLYFAGLNAMNLYGGPVPLTSGNIYHLGNKDPLPGEDLLEELMNGVRDKKEWRRYISSHDLAILKDCDLPVKIDSIVLATR